MKHNHCLRSEDVLFPLSNLIQKNRVYLSVFGIRVPESQVDLFNFHPVGTV